MRAKEPLRVGIVGCGEVAQVAHIPALLKIKNVRLVAACDKNEDLGRKAAKRFHISKYYADFSEMLEREKLDIVSICTPPHSHAPLSIQAMKAGVSVLVEKPMCSSTREAQELLKVQRATGVMLVVVHSILFQRSVLQARSMIAHGDIGDVLTVEANFLSTRDDPMIAQESHWCHSIPGGRIAEALPPPLYLLQEFLGELRLGTVWAGKLGSYPWVRFDELHAVLNSSTGYGIVRISFNAPLSAQTMCIYGLRGTINIDLLSQLVVVSRRGRFAKRFAQPKKTPRAAIVVLGRLLRELCRASLIVVGVGKNTVPLLAARYETSHDGIVREFAKALLSGGQAPVTPEDAFRVVSYTDQIVSAMEKM